MRVVFKDHKDSVEVELVKENVNERARSLFPLKVLKPMFEGKLSLRVNTESLRACSCR